MASLGLVGLAGARRRRRSGGGIAALALLLAGSSVQGCCDPAVSTDGEVASETSSTSESSTTGDGGSAESTGESGLPGWVVGVFSDQTDKVGTTIDNPFWYVWSNIEISASGAMVFEQYNCATHQQRQELRWTLADDGQSLNLEPVPPSELFEFGSDSFISEVIIEPGDSCDAIAIRYFNTDTMQWVEVEYLRGEVCAAAADPDVCTFTFEWCDSAPPPSCE